MALRAATAAVVVLLAAAAQATVSSANDGAAAAAEDLLAAAADDAWHDESLDLGVDAAAEGCGCGGTGRGDPLDSRAATATEDGAGTVRLETGQAAADATVSVAAASWLEQSTVLIPAGRFHMGTDVDGIPGDGEGPARWVEIPRPYRMDKTEVSNRQFAEFVRATGHLSDAEKYGWSFVPEWMLSPEANAKSTEAVQNAPWWIKVDGAAWNHPFGPDSSLDGLEDQPVVHVSYNDAKAYCAWRGGRVPTEAEWERAARGGVEDQRFPWGDDLLVDGKHRCNIWQGRFPAHNTGEDGYTGTAPVVTYEPNAYGLYQMIGNVWEWTSSPFMPNAPLMASKGGSFLCHKSYCDRYRNSARTRNEPDSSTANIGMRCAYDV